MKILVGPYMKLTLQTGEIYDNPTTVDVKRGISALDVDDCLYFIIDKDENERVRAFIDQTGYRLDYLDRAMGRAIYSELIEETTVLHFILSKFVSHEPDWFETVEWTPGQIEVQELVRGWVYFFCLWPMYLLLIGGAIGGLVGGLATLINFQTMRMNSISYGWRLFLVAISGIWAFIVYSLLAVVFLALFTFAFG